MQRESDDCPPIAIASPSPMTVITVISGFASLMPVANVRALPWVVWMLPTSTYTGNLPEHPIPATRTTSSLLRPIFTKARTIEAAKSQGRNPDTTRAGTSCRDAASHREVLRLSC